MFHFAAKFYLPTVAGAIDLARLGQYRMSPGEIAIVYRRIDQARVRGQPPCVA
jgi:hypothetical protein